MGRRTRRLLLFGLPAGVAVALAAGWLLWPHTAITAGNAAKIQKGMTLAEVEAILGGPPRDESTVPLVVTLPKEDGNALDHGDAEISLVLWRAAAADGAAAAGAVVPRQWVTNRLLVAVYFDADGRVLEVHCLPTRRADETLLDRLRRWLGL
jgi:hypothetical protein